MDIQYLLMLQHFREATGYVLDGFFAKITHLGSLYPAIVIMALVYWSISKKTGLYLLLADLWATFTGQTLKIICCVYRPWVRSSLIEPVADALSGATGYSFPSGHTLNAVTLFGGLFARTRAAAGKLKAAQPNEVNFPQPDDAGAGRSAAGSREAVSASSRGRTRKVLSAVSWLSLALAIIVPFSRNYCEVHTPQDVLVGALIALFWLWAAGRILKACEDMNGLQRMRIVAAVTIVAAAVCIIYAACKSYPMDLAEDGSLLMNPADMVKDTYRTAAGVIGAMLGVLTEMRFARFTTDGISMRTRILRFVGGLIVTGIVLLPVGKLLYLAVGKTIGRFLKYFLMTYVLVGGWPWVFTRIERGMEKRN